MTGPADQDERNETTMIEKRNRFFMKARRIFSARIAYKLTIAFIR